MDKINLCNKRILVTGGNGYLGRNLIKKLISKKTLVFSLDIQDNCLSENSEYFQVDINDKELLNKAINDIQPSIIYHLAASLNRTRDFEYTEKIFHINLNGTINLLNALKKIEYENFIFTSTSEIYGGKSIKPPFKEDDNFIPASPYSLSKYCAETSIKTFSEMYQKNYTILRLFNFYGPDMPNQFFIPQLISALKNNENFNMTKGKQVRDFLFINDIIQAMILSTDINAYNEVFNVCSGQGITLHDLALQLKMILNSKSKINFGAVPYRENEVWEMVGGNTKIKETLKFKQKYLLIEGLNNLL